MADDLSLPTHTDSLGETRVLGTLPPTMRAIAGLAALATRSIRLIPESEWRVFEIPPGPIKVKDQDGKGACNGHALATSLEWDRYLSGMSHVDLSAWFGYSIMCNGIDRGSMIEDALVLGTEKGLPPESMVEYGTINPRRLSPESYEAAKGHRIEIGSVITNFDELMSAVQLLQPGNFSLRVGGPDGVDSDGVVTWDTGMGNHAITFIPGAKKTSRGDWAVRWQNSWSARWGQNGFAWVTRRQIDNQRYFSAYTVAAAVDKPGDPLNPPIAK